MEYASLVLAIVLNAKKIHVTNVKLVISLMRKEYVRLVEVDVIVVNIMMK